MFLLYSILIINKEILIILFAIWISATVYSIHIFFKEELENAYSVAFSADGSKIYAGIRKFLRVFYTERPGNISEQRPRSGSIIMLNYYAQFV